MTDFVSEFAVIQMRCHENSVKHGFWDNPQDNHPGNKLMLMVSKLAEAFEHYRNSTENETSIGSFTNLEEELADVVIRVMDFAEYNDLRLAEVIEAKTHFNEIRAYKHGKRWQL